MYKDKKTGRHMGMRGKMFLYLAGFSLIVLAVLWVFQIVLLDDVYRATVRRQTIEAVQDISKLSPNSEDYTEKLYKEASENGLCISVFRIEEVSGGKVAEELVHAHNRSACAIHSSVPNDGFLSELYSTTEKADGRYIRLVGAENSETDGSYICSDVFEKEEQVLFAVVNKEIQPVASTASTLRLQLIYISVILLAVSALLSYVITSRLARPVVKMNEQAKRLATGNYDVNFEGGEFLETQQLAGTLNYAADELSKLDVMQKELMANISHDLRTPLTMIGGYSEVMRDIPGEMSAENIQVIIDETHRLSTLVSDMLDLSRLAGGKRELHLERFSLTKCVEETVERYAHLKNVEGYKIEFAAEGEVFTLADETLILQVLYNLINNAINYTGDDKRVVVSQKIENGVCRISVTDSGEGIAAENLPLVWDRYYRVGDYHKRAVTGTGLGLSIVKNVMIQHGAQFGVSSTVGVGSTFWFELPVDNSQESQKGENTVCNTLGE